MYLPAAAVRDAGELLDVNMDQFAWPVTDIAADGFGAGSVAFVESAETGLVEDVLNRRRGEAGFVCDVIGAPTMPLAKSDALGAPARRCPVR